MRLLAARAGGRWQQKHGPHDSRAHLGTGDEAPGITLSTEVQVVNYLVFRFCPGQCPPCLDDPWATALRRTYHGRLLARCRYLAAICSTQGRNRCGRCDGDGPSVRHTARYLSGTSGMTSLAHFT